MNKSIDVLLYGYLCRFKNKDEAINFYEKYMERVSSKKRIRCKNILKQLKTTDKKMINEFFEDDCLVFGIDGNNKGYLYTIKKFKKPIKYSIYKNKKGVNKNEL